MHTHRLAALSLAVSGALLLPPLTASSQTHVTQSLAEAKWGPAPPALPPGAQIAVLSGNPMADGLYTIRLKFPAGYRIPAHSHPKDEHVTVLSGELFMGHGSSLDTKLSHRLGVGGYALVPAGTNHFAYTQKETTILLHGIGPVDFTYVAAKDDPRSAGTR